MAQRNPDPAEFSRPIAVDGLGEEAVVERIEATAGERAALARRLDLLALDRLAATLELRRAEGGEAVRLTGRLEAEVTQACVVTLAPVSSRLEEEFSLLYGPESDPDRAGGEVLVDLDEEDGPEPIPPGGLDLGEVVAEQLALALDPYPRAEGAGLEQSEWGDAEDGAGRKPNPFAVLSSLKKS